MKITDTEYDRLMKIYVPDKFRKEEIKKLKQNLSYCDDFGSGFISGDLKFINKETKKSLKITLDIYKREDDWFLVKIEPSTVAAEDIYKFDGILNLINFINTIKKEVLNDEWFHNSKLIRKKTIGLKKYTNRFWKWVEQNIYGD